MKANFQQLNVAVAGAGFAGLACASLLARDGHRVTVFDKFAQPQALGAGILIQPSGLAAMRVLGVADEIVASGARVDHLWGVTPRQRPVVNVRYDDWQPGAFGLGLHRGVLFQALWRQAQAGGVDLRPGHELRELAWLERSHDLVVVADGGQSTLRPQMGLPCRDEAYPWGAVWAVLDDPRRDWGSTLWQWCRRAGQMLGVMPTGLAPGSSTPVVSLFWSLRADRHAALLAAGLDAFKADVLALAPRCAPLMDQLTDMGQLTWARYRDVVMPRYHTDRSVVLGDAAHATSPQLGQGTNLALLDAVALRDSLRAMPTVAQALAHYSAQRRGHLHFYSQASRWLTPLFQSDQIVLPWLRDVFMDLSGRWPLLGPLARDTLVGVRQGWFQRKPLPLPKEPRAGGSEVG